MAVSMDAENEQVTAQPSTVVSADHLSIVLDN